MANENTTVTNQDSKSGIDFYLECSDNLTNELEQALGVTYLIWEQFQGDQNRYNDEIMSNVVMTVEYRLKAALREIREFADIREARLEAEKAQGNSLSVAASSEAKQAYLKRFTNFFLSAKGMQLKTNFAVELIRLLGVCSDSEQCSILACLETMIDETYKGAKV